jgi:hypothetical protein
MKLFARVNRIGWVHLWPTRQAFELGEPSFHFFNGKSDPRWQGSESARSGDQRARLAAGELVEIEDPGYWDESES